MKKLSIAALSFFVLAISVTAFAQQKNQQKPQQTPIQKQQTQVVKQTTSAYSQLQQGKLALAVNPISITFYQGDISDYQDTTIAINDNMYFSGEYFIMPMISLGGALQYNDEGDTSSWGIGILGNYYIPYDIKIFFNVGAQIFYQIQKTKVKSYDIDINLGLPVEKTVEYKTKIFSPGVFADANYLLTNYLALTGGVEVSYISMKPEGGKSTTGFSFGLRAGVKVFM